MNKGDLPTAKRAPLMNTDRMRESANIDHRCDDDGFWRYGYGNDPERRRLIRHVEKYRLKKALDNPEMI